MRFIVAQIGARRGYAVPAILEKAGMLEQLYTDVCFDVGLGGLLASVSRLPFVSGRAQRLRGRRLPEPLRSKTTTFAMPVLIQSFRRVMAGRDPAEVFRNAL